MPDTPGRPSRRAGSGDDAADPLAPFIGAGDPLDHALAPPFDLRRVERAAALVRPDAGEPRTTLHTELWREARERAARLRRTRAGSALVRLLEHQERGWEYVRPLALAAEEAGRGEAAPPHPAAALYRFVDAEVVDLYRYNAFRCAHMVPGTGFAGGPPSTDDIDAETDHFYRCVVLLRMAAAHRLAPPELRVVASHAAGLDGWYADFAAVFAPAAEAFQRRLRGSGP